MNTKQVAVAAALIITLGLAGCTPPQAPTLSDTEPEVTTPAAEPVKSEEPEPEPAASEYAPFGGTYTYPDGVTISVSTVRDFVPSEYAAGADNPANIVFDVTIVNGTAEAFDTFASGSLTSGGRSGSQIFDSGNPALPDDGLASVGTTLLPGQSITWTEAWSVLDPADLTYTISPTMVAYEDAIFTTG